MLLVIFLRFNAMKKPWKKCIINGCSATVNPRNKQNKCPRCKTRWYRNTHPLKYYFNKLRSRTKERGHEFSLTFEQYHSFCLNTDYHKLKGKTSLSLSVDRINGREGYHASNIRAITLSNNSRKEWVPYFRKQNQQPDAEDIAAAEAAMAASMDESENQNQNEN